MIITREEQLMMQKVLLGVKYETLSRIREEFPRKSNHKAVSYIEKELTRLINEISIINDKLKSYGK